MEYKSLGDYVYNSEQIDQGSFSKIYKGYKIKNRKEVAIKKLTRTIEEKYITSEVQLMYQLDSKYILKLYDVIKHKGDIYLVLEYCNNGNLCKYINSRETKFNLNYIYQIISGLKYLYKNKIIHRDIKPQNILIHNNTIKICDFGFAKKINDNDLLNTFCGSPLYMAPELLKYSEYSEKSDIWSLGVIIYEILFKVHPYTCNKKIDLIKYIKSDKEIEISKLIDKDLRDLLIRMLKKDPYIRISWEEIFDHNWVENYDLVDYRVDKDLLDFNCVFEDDDEYDFDYNNKPISEVSMSLCNLKNNDLFSSDRKAISVMNKKDIITKLDIYDDCKVYSRSAPSRDCAYLENYIDKKIPMDNNYNILGTSPNVRNNNSLYNYLHKSVNKLKNIFKFSK